MGLRQHTTRIIAALGLLGAAVLTGPAVQAEEDPRCNRTNNSVSKLLECVTVEGVVEHAEALQAIADANGGNRASGTPGYDASVAYVVDRMRAAGYDVSVQTFVFHAFAEAGPSALQQVAPAMVTYTEGTDFGATPHSEPGDVTALVTAVDLQLGLGNASTSGCEAADFAGFPAGHIALIQRGACTFELKAENAAAAGAVGVLFFNQGNTAERTEIPPVTLSNDYTGGLPALSMTYELGAELSTVAGLQMRMFANVTRERADTYNVLAESKSGDPGNVIMAGAHLDSVGAGPGINDNGSGSAALLEIAEQLQKVKHDNQVRFAWWGAEESGLVGSTFYVDDLAANDPAALEDIEMYLNFDMVASPNYGLFIYDGDGSGFGLVGPDGSDDIEALFERYFVERDLQSEPTAFSGRSDYQAFINHGVPSGGLFTGADGVKTAAQQAKWGGEAGITYDPCYHAACDTIDNLNHEALDINADAIAYVISLYASGKEGINR